MAAMTSAVLVDIQDEVTCPICLELLKEPLSIDCGHSFCQACITENSKESQIGQEGESSCPVCQTSYQLRNLRPNRHLANIAERLREVVLGSGEPLKVILCAHHREKLQLFCKEDGKLICWLCERSQDHRGHHTFLMEEIAQEYQEKFQESLKRLRQEQQEAEKLKAVIIEKRTSWKNQMEPERHRIQTEFNQLRSILDKEEQRQLKKLEEEERKGLNIMEEAEDELAHQSQALKELISDLERRCQGSTVELLQDVSAVTERSEYWALKKPEDLPTKLKSAFRAPDLKKMLRVFRELTDVQSYWALQGSYSECRHRAASGEGQLERKEGAAAMALKFLVNMKEKVTCAICLKLLTEPLSLNCGHSFCQACITDNKASEIGPGGESSCPVCGVRYSLGNLWLNQHLANIVERVKEVKLSPEEGQKKDLCLSHGERLRLFCKEDRKAICQLCEWSREHCGHQIFLMEEVVKECQEKLQASLDRLRKEHQEAEKLGSDIREERTSWKNQIQAEKQRIHTEFNQLRSILDSEEQRELQKLEEEETKTLQDLAEAENELVQQSQLLKELISDLEHRSEWSAMELLQDTSGTMKWSEVWTLKKPKTISKKLKHGFHAPDLSGMLHMFKELTNVQRYWVDMTFNPFNLNLNLNLSEDHRQLASVPIWPIKYYNYGVLGSQYFSSGKHYWEIDVSKKTAWILGVYCRKRSCNKKFRRGTNYPNAYSRFRPENGYWVVRLQNESEYNAFEDSSTSDPKVLTLSMAVPPRRVGIFLDYEASTVSFFNVTNHGSLIYKFSKCHFSQVVYPYFNPWNCPAPMTLCPPSS
ncbi:PREDICTED: tripartite motif-containing protein 34 isoform X4 [Myotis davidii]|uniref:tripartite motif-containing protein 34 isoform X4 n=2 Tax=Myotis davidii TaxID=225400 RepID=UPI000767DAEC|nr:PREDICTED: tripartite motif-containing protein 34 isoform X4 [Myotis davidii]